MTDDAIPKPGDLVAAKYRIEALIGKGGMGAVMSATHTQLQTKVALKFLLEGGARSAVRAERFAREARIGATLKSDYSVRISDTGVHNGDTPFMVMEHLEGHDMVRHANDGDLPTLTVVTYMLQICEALAEAHGKNITHRDLKPANLFVVRRVDGQPHVKVLDFGIAKVAEALGAQSDLTKTAALMGSPLYMPPERLRAAKDADPRGDVWALGAILFELLAGEAAFEGSTLPVVCSNILNREPRSLIKKRPDVAGSLDAIVRRCLEKDINKRYPHVAALAGDLAVHGGVHAHESVARCCVLLGVDAQSLGPLSALAANTKDGPYGARPLHPEPGLQFERGTSGGNGVNGGEASAPANAPSPATTMASVAVTSATRSVDLLPHAETVASTAGPGGVGPASPHSAAIATSLESASMPSRQEAKSHRGWAGVAIAVAILGLGAGGTWMAMQRSSGEVSTAASDQIQDAQNATSTSLEAPPAAPVASVATSASAIASASASASAMAATSSHAIVPPPPVAAPHVVRPRPLPTVAPNPKPQPPVPVESGGLFDDRK